MEKKITSNELLLLSMFLFFFISLISKSYNSVLSSFLVFYDLGVVTIIAITYMFRGEEKVCLSITFLGVCVVWNTAAIWLNQGGIGSLFNSFFVPLYIYSLSKMKMSTRTKKAFIYMFSLYIIVLSFFIKSIMSVYSWSLSNTVNPNTYGSTAAFCYIYCMILCREVRIKNRRFIALILLLLTLYCSYVSECRMALYFYYTTFFHACNAGL